MPETNPGSVVAPGRIARPHGGVTPVLRTVANEYPHVRGHLDPHRAMTDASACSSRARVRAPSADFVKRMQNDPASVGSKEYTRALALSGGLPIKVGDDVVGAVGVSGSSPGKDDDCSQAGIDKVAAQLK